jgi:leucyl aminopeptidase
MALHLTTRASGKTLPITPIHKARLSAWLKTQPKRLRAWVSGTGFTADTHEILFVPGRDGSPERVLAGIGRGGSYLAYAGLPTRLPKGRYTVDGKVERDEANALALGWAIGTYRFDRYKKKKKGEELATLVWPEGSNRAEVRRVADAVFLVRDLINTPAADMGPAELAAAAKKLAKKHGAKCSVVTGEALLTRNYPTVYAVGKGSSRAPRLIDLRWGSGSRPRLTIVGKGVCFDSGGLDLKPASAMLLMKKDMGGAAHALGLAHLVMDSKLPVRLRVLIPAVENFVSGDSYRPLDVLTTRKGLTVEVGNTDAEGRLVLCDALAAANEEKPDLVLDFATLTGAARVALGTELPALFCNSDKVANAYLEAGIQVDDQLWRLPPHERYRRHLESRVADLNNVSSGRFGGAITAALFLSSFVDKKTPWAHLDLMAWNSDSRPGRPSGGEAMALRATYHFLTKRYRRKK